MFFAPQAKLSKFGIFTECTLLLKNWLRDGSNWIEHLKKFHVDSGTGFRHRVDFLGLAYRDGENTADPETAGTASTACPRLRSALRARQARPITVPRS